MHIDTINQVKNYINEKDFEGLKKYIERREKEILEQDENKSSDYIENLVNNLSWYLISSGVNIIYIKW